MKSLNFGYSLGIALIVSNSLVLAQDVPPPKLPLLPPLPEVAEVTIQYQYEKNVPISPSSSSNAPKLGQEPIGPQVDEKIQTMVIQKRGGFFHANIHYVGGKTIDVWSSNGREISREGGDPAFIRLAPNHINYINFGSLFEDIMWIDMSNYVGFKQGEHVTYIFKIKNKVRPLAGLERMYFESEKQILAMESQSVALRGAANQDPEAPMDGPTSQRYESTYGRLFNDYIKNTYGESEATVTLDQATQLPISYDTGFVVHNYTFNLNPTPLVFPPEVIAQYQRLEQQENDSRAP